VKPRRRRLGRLGDNLPNAEIPAGTSEAEHEAVTQEHSIAVPLEVAQRRTTTNLSSDTVRERRRRLGIRIRGDSDKPER